MSEYDPSPEHVKTLIRTHWHNGWRSATGSTENLPSSTETAAAKRAGLIFEHPQRSAHDGLVQAVRQLALQTDLNEASTAFVTSLTSHRLDLRSALSSLTVARQLANHGFVGSDSACGVCGLPNGEIEIDPNELNFERFMWGGVRKADLEYIVFDLEQFALAPKLEPTPDDIRAGQALLTELAALPPKTTAAQASTLLKIPKGNKAERAALLDGLGIMDVLTDTVHLGYSKQFVNFADRDLPDDHFVDREYPVCWWSAENGIDANAVSEFLPLLATKTTS